MKNAGSIEIDRSIEDVFELTNNHVAEWSVIVVEDTVVEGDGGVGSRFHMVTEEKGRRMEFQGIVTRHDPPYRNAIQMTGELFDIEAEYTFEDLGGRTRVTQHSRVSGKGYFRPILMIFGLFMRKSSCDALHNELRSLKQFCERTTMPARSTSATSY